MSENLNHRKAETTLKIISANGRPVANQELGFRLLNHEFLFGVGGFDAIELEGGNTDGTAVTPERTAFLIDKLDKYFAIHNYTTLPFYSGRYEPEEGKPDEKRLKAAALWYQKRNISVKGHPLCWHTVCSPWLMNYSNKEILSKLKARIERDVAAFAGLIDIWDVINEVVIMPIFDKYDNAVTRVCKEIGRVRMIKEVFASARAANLNATLILNDFDTSIDFEILIDGCLQSGVPIDVIGIQSHQHQGYWGAQKVCEVLERFAHFGLPLHFTENTFISGDLMPAHIVDLNDWQVDEWPSTPEGEARQAENFTEMYSLLFEHPSVQAITTWSGSDNAWLHAPAGLLHTDNSIKPSYTALETLIKKVWHSEGKACTDSQGKVKLSGFKGQYEIDCIGKRYVFNLDGKAEEQCLVFSG